MKRGACECNIYSEGASAARKGVDDALLVQRANIAFVAPGQALVVSPNDLVLKKGPTAGSVAKGAIAANAAQTIRKGRFLRSSPQSQFCSHRFVCPRCPWQHIDPVTAPHLKSDTARRLVARALWGAEQSDDVPAAVTGVEWLEPLQLVNGSLRSRAVTFHFGVTANGSYALGVPISDFFSGTRGQDRVMASEGEEASPGGIMDIPTVESVSEKCILLTPTQREVAGRLERLWSNGSLLRRGAGDGAGVAQNNGHSPRTLRSVTFVESAATRSMLVRIAVFGRDADSNALRSYSDPTGSLTALEAQLLDAVLKGCVTCDGGVHVEVVVEGRGDTGSGAALRYRQLYPRVMASSAPTTTVRDVLEVVVPTAADADTTARLRLSAPLEARGAGQGMFRYVGGVEAVVAATIALASESLSPADDANTDGSRSHSLVDFPSDNLSQVLLEAAVGSGLWDQSSVSDAAAFEARLRLRRNLTADFTGGAGGAGSCMLTRVYGQGPRSARSFEALSKASHLFGTTVAVCEDEEALCSLFQWLRERGVVASPSSEGAGVSVAVLDVDPMSHHFCAIVRWESLGRRPVERLHVSSKREADTRAVRSASLRGGRHTSGNAPK